MAFEQLKCSSSNGVIDLVHFVEDLSTAPLNLIRVLHALNGYPRFGGHLRSPLQKNKQTFLNSLETEGNGKVRHAE